MFSLRSLIILLVVSLGLTFVMAAPVDSPDELEVDAELEKRIPQLCTPQQRATLNQALYRQSGHFTLSIAYWRLIQEQRRTLSKRSCKSQSHVRITLTPSYSQWSIAESWTRVWTSPTRDTTDTSERSPQLGSQRSSPISWRQSTRL